MMNHLPVVYVEHHDETGSLTYLVWDSATRDAVLVDPVLDYHPESGSYSCRAAESLTAVIEREELRLHYVLETHIHADHLSSSEFFRNRFGARLVVGNKVPELIVMLRDALGIRSSAPKPQHLFDVFVADSEVLVAGSLRILAMHTPGHTVACVSYLIGDSVFVGDVLLPIDQGTGRCDFPSGSSEMLFDSIREVIYTLPGDTRVFVGHDYQLSGGPASALTVDECRQSNLHLTDQTPHEDFTVFRDDRDKGLALPRLFKVSVCVNMVGGSYELGQALAAEAAL